MTDEQALYRAICANPDDDLPRLAFADLMEEQGDSLRARFIRTQLELSRLKEYDPFWVKCQQLYPDAFTGWGMAHTLPLMPEDFGWHHFLFRRGFPWQAGVGCPTLQDDTSLFDSAPIQSLTFSNRSVLTDGPLLTRIRRLELEGPARNSMEVQRLIDSPHTCGLAELRFEYEGVDADSLRLLAESPRMQQLEILEISMASLPPALLVDSLGAVETTGALRKLSLEACGLTALDAAHLFSLPVVRGLESLSLFYNSRLGAEGVCALAESGLVANLTILNLTRTFPGVPGVRALAETGALASVRSLNLSENRLGPVAVKRLAASPGASGLRVLSLAHNLVNDAGARSLADSPHLAGLFSLDLSNAGVGDAGAQALANSPYLDGLLRLDLRLNRLGLKSQRLLRDRFGPLVSFDDASPGTRG